MSGFDYKYACGHTPEAGDKIRCVNATGATPALRSGAEYRVQAVNRIAGIVALGDRDMHPAVPERFELLSRASDVEKCETPAPDMKTAKEIATRAAELVAGDRDRQHGEKQANFDRIAKLWQAWLEIRKDQTAQLGAHDVGVMMNLMKCARTQSGAVNIDDYVDAAGYIACAGEIVQSGE